MSATGTAAAGLRARRRGAAGRPALKGILDPVRPSLEAVSACLLEELTDPLAQRVVYLITAGGKRLRPALVLLAGHAARPAEPGGVVRAAAAVELIHTATLIHDDIIDVSAVRRQQPTFHARWGTERAVLTGDYLYATAFAMLGRLGDPVVTAWMADVCRELSVGELREVEARYRLDLSEAEYLAIIREKTASLIGACCQIGARLGGFPEEAVRRFGDFGVQFGLAFQIVDDCLDLAGSARELGKSIHADLDKGVVSLPIIYLLEGRRGAARRRLFAPVERAAARGRDVDGATLARIAGAARDTGAIERAYGRARACAEDARSALAGVALNGVEETYHQLTAYAVSRRS
ncbi:MAG TPA: polyprenyl synthetase family protein [bacterium]